MPLINKLNYDKIPPWRDATLFLVICEGEKREYQYFDFFNGLDAKLKVIAIPSAAGHTAPKHLEINAVNAVKEKVDDEGTYELWIVLDLDRWPVTQIHDLQKICKDKENWFIAISNPCFEVWLYYHFRSNIPTIENLEKAKTWKQLLPTVQSGGFNSDFHPTLVQVTNKNSEINYSEDGYIPDVGATQLHRLGKKIYALIKKTLQKFLNDYDG